MGVSARQLILAATLSALPLVARAQAPVPAPVFKVDGVTITVTPKHRLIVTANGAVRSGGWSNPQLRAGKHGEDPHTLVFDLVANPPPKNAIVIEAIMPVQASESIAMPPSSITQIKVNSETGSATATINR
jgi:hypothetical protein